MDAFQPPGAASVEEVRAQLPMVRYARIVLIVLAAFNGLVALAIPPAYYLIGSADPELGSDGATMMAAFGVCVSLGILAISVGPMVYAVYGLGRGQKAAWYVTVIVGALYVPSICLPVGGFLLYAMLNDEVRKAFLD